MIVFSVSRSVACKQHMFILTAMLTGCSIRTAHGGSTMLRNRSNTAGRVLALSLFLLRDTLNSVEITMKLHCEPVNTVYANISNIK